MYTAKARFHKTRSTAGRQNSWAAWKRTPPDWCMHLRSILPSFWGSSLSRNLSLPRTAWLSNGRTNKNCWDGYQRYILTPEAESQLNTTCASYTNTLQRNRKLRSNDYRKGYINRRVSNHNRLPALEQPASVARNTRVPEDTETPARSRTTTISALRLCQRTNCSFYCVCMSIVSAQSSYQWRWLYVFLQEVDLLRDCCRIVPKRIQPPCPHSNKSRGQRR